MKREDAENRGNSQVKTQWCERGYVQRMSGGSFSLELGVTGGNGKRRG